MPTLSLTAAERTLFDRLPEDAKKGWEVEEEGLTFEDSEQQQAVRFRNMVLTDERLLALRERAPDVKSLDDVQRIMGETGLSNIPHDDLMELFFALGPSALTDAVHEVLRDAKGAEDIEKVHFLSTVRHHLLVSLQPTS